MNPKGVATHLLSLESWLLRDVLFMNHFQTIYLFPCSIPKTENLSFEHFPSLKGDFYVVGYPRHVSLSLLLDKVFIL